MSTKFLKKTPTKTLSLKTILLVFRHFEKKNHKNVLIGHLNINSKRRKFETLTKIIDKNFDILLVSEMKLV